MLYLYGAFLVLQFILTLGVDAASFNCSEPPNFANYDVNSCCRIPEINLGAAPQQCDKYVSGLRVPTPTMPPTPTTPPSEDEANFPAYTHVCYPECIYRETGSLVNDEIKLENVKKFLENNVNRRDKDIVPYITRSFETCLTSIKGHMQTTGISSYAKLPEGCSPYGSMVYGCVNTETFLHCPAKMWKNDHNCNLAKNFAEQCNPLPHVPFPAM